VPARYWVLLLWACFVLRGAFYACAIPLWEGFDEYAHYARIEFLATEGREPSRTTPVPQDVAESLTRVPAKNGGMTYDEYWKLTPEARHRSFPASAARIYEFQQPPLFYWLSAALYRITGDISLPSRVIVMRIFCVLLASFCLPFGFLIARRVLGNSTLALGAGALIASMPVLTFTATHVANEGLAIGLGTVLVWSVVERKRTALLFSLGAALLTKAYFLAFLPPIVLLLFCRNARRSTAIALAGAAAIAGWWYWLTWATTGSLTGNVILVHPGLAEMARTMLRFPALKAADFAWITFLWIGNWSFVVVRAWMYWAMAALCVVALAGIVSLVWKRNAGVALLSAFVFSFALAIAYFALGSLVVYGRPDAYGWYACCLVAPIAVLLFLGLRTAIPRFKAAAGPILVIALGALELFGTHIYLWPYYTGFISHLPNGGLPAFRLAQLGNGGFQTIFQRLTLYKPTWMAPPLLIAAWAMFLIATVALAVVSIYFARLARTRPVRAE
jgi:4-amino-4-deoxy-L-arabinose transferase-like glycosyltransferase